MSPPPWRQRALSAGARAGLVSHRVVDPEWALPDLRIAVLADLHVCAPWTPLSAVARIVTEVNALDADLILIAGDVLAHAGLPARREPAAAVAAALAPLAAPLGVYAVLGNHDWKDCKVARASGYARNSVREALAGTPIGLLENRAVQLGHGSGFWLVGLDSQYPGPRRRSPGRHDPEAAFATVPPGAPAILLAHEPDCFAEADPRAFLQISGHTHGGQANLFGWRPLTPSRYGGRYAWGHVRDGGRHLIVSGGIGYSGLPLRLFQPPEITLVSVSCRG